MSLNKSNTQKQSVPRLNKIIQTQQLNSISKQKKLISENNNHSKSQNRNDSKSPIFQKNKQRQFKKKVTLDKSILNISLTSQIKKFHVADAFSETINFKNEEKPHKQNKYESIKRKQDSIKRNQDSITRKQDSIKRKLSPLTKQQQGQQQQLEKNNKTSHQRSIKRNENVESSLKGISKSQKLQTPQNKKPSKDVSLSRSNLSKSIKSANKKSANRIKYKFNVNQRVAEDQWLKQNMKQVKNKTLHQLSEQFSSQVEKPMNQLTDIAISSTQQRCLQHNNAFSLYCPLDRQLLCVGCIYKSKQHKNHRLLPLIKASKQISEDIESFKHRIEQTILTSDQLARQSNLYLVKIQKDYPALVHKVQLYYYQIHQMVQDKKRQQLDYLQSLRNQLKIQAKVISSQLNFIHNFILDKLRQIQMPVQKLSASKINPYLTKQPKSSIKQNKKLNEKGSQQNGLQIATLVVKRCGYEILSKLHKILNKHCDSLIDQKKGFDFRLNHYYQVFDLIKYKLTMVIPVMKKQVEDSMSNKTFSGIEIKKQEQPNLKPQKVEVNKQKAKQGQTKAQLLNQVREHVKEQKNENKKGFSTSPQVPRGISRRFLQISQEKYSPKKVIKNE